MKNEIKEKDKIINEYAKIINGTKIDYQKLYAENIKYRDKLKRQQEHDQQEYEQEMREKEIYESKIESEPEAYHNYSYDESDGKTLPPKKKIIRDT